MWNIIITQLIMTCSKVVDLFLKNGLSVGKSLSAKIIPAAALLKISAAMLVHRWFLSTG